MKQNHQKAKYYPYFVKIPKNIVYLFFDRIVCKFGMPKKIISDCDPRFV